MGIQLQPLDLSDCNPLASDANWLIEQLNTITTQLITRKVSEWAEEKRYIPPHLSSHGGWWDNNYTPFLTQIMDCFSAASSVRKVAVMKGAQVGVTTGVLENFIGYVIDDNPGSMMYVSADKALTQMGIEVKVDAMLQSSGLSHKLQSKSSDSRKSGNTNAKKEFPGGFLIAVGAQNPGKLRSMSIQNMLLDEIDGMPNTLGDEGSPISLAEARTVSFEHTRKILYISTPLVTQTSKILKEFQRGDQRKYNIPCPHCKQLQELEWRAKREDGTYYGIVFDWDETGRLIHESVGYSCKHCAAIFYDHDKTWFLPRGKWIATAQPQEIGFRSYHLNALLSPVGMQSWTAVVYKWMECWDVLRDRLKDPEKRRTFENLQKGLPWEERGESPKFERVVAHRRAIYSQGEIPNIAAIEETGSPILLLTAAADVHKDRIDIEVMGWCRDGRSYSVEWLHIEGDTQDLGSSGPWAEVRKLYSQQIWTADDDKQYRIACLFIDAGYRSQTVYQFAAEMGDGVYPVMGREMSVAGSKLREFAEYQSKAGTPGYHITVTIYKDRMAAWLRQDWISGKQQPVGYPNYPQDYRDDYFREYENETKDEKICKKTGRRLGFFWRRHGDNHAWDCRVYNMAALDMLALSICEGMLGLDHIDYDKFWTFIESNCVYFYQPGTTGNLV